MREHRICFVFKFGNNALRQNFAEFNSPLIERVDIPDGSLGEDRMFIQRDQLSKNFWCEFFGEDRIRRAVAFEDPMRDKPIGRSLGLYLCWSLAERKRLGLRANICQKHVVVPPE